MPQTVLLLGPSLSAVSGVSTHLNQLFSSSLALQFRLVHFQVGREGRSDRLFRRLFRFVSSPIALAVKLFALRPAIVHLNTSLDRKAFWRDAVYLLIAKALGRRVLYQVHGGDLPEVFFGTSVVKRRIGRLILQRPDAVVLLAEIERRAYERFTPLRRLSVIPNAINLDNGTSENLSERFSHEPLRLGYIGRLVEAKGIMDIVEALHLLSERGIHGFRLVIAGAGPMERTLRERIDSLSLDKEITLAGPLFGEAKLRFWQNTDLFVFPTFHPEGLPYTVLESLAMGVPMVTTRIGGISDAVTEGTHAIFVQPHDPSAIAEALLALTSNREQLQRMSVACRRRAVEQYSIERLARQMSELYNTVLG
jgi:glycosyltransferase involved in cell wall biosynthesis